MSFKVGDLVEIIKSSRKYLIGCCGTIVKVGHTIVTVQLPYETLIGIDRETHSGKNNRWFLDKELVRLVTPAPTSSAHAPSDQWEKLAAELYDMERLPIDERPDFKVIEAFRRRVTGERKGG